MSNALLLALGFFLLAVQNLIAKLSDAVGLGEWAYPSLVLPVVLFLAVGDVSLARGSLLSFVLGYFVDAFAGLPLGLNTFLMQVLFLLSRVAGLKLFLHGKVFQLVLTFVAGIAGGALTVALHVVFERAQGRLAIGHAMMVVLTQSIATGLFAPLVFAALARLPGAPAATQAKDA